MIIKSKSEVYCNSRTVVYPDGSTLVMVADRAIFRRPGFELASDRKQRSEGDRLAYLDWLAEVRNPELEMMRLEREGKLMELPDTKDEENRRRSVRRAKSALRDLVRSNSWDYFVTLTLDASKVDRYDMTAVTKKLQQWADNQVRRHDLAYVLVPELHKDGAIHFHGFFRGGSDAVDSGTLTKAGSRPRKPRSKKERERFLADGWQIVYNLPGWSLGFTTAIRPYGDMDAAAAYICKYITKEAATTGKIGGRWYYSGGDLLRPKVVYGDGDIVAAAELPGAWDGTIPALGVRLVMFRTNGEGEPFNSPNKRNGGIEHEDLETGAIRDDEGAGRRAVGAVRHSG